MALERGRHLLLPQQQCGSPPSLNPCVLLRGPLNSAGPDFTSRAGLSAKAISSCSAFLASQGSPEVRRFQEIYHRNAGRQFNNAAVDSREKPGIYLM